MQRVVIIAHVPELDALITSLVELLDYQTVVLDDSDLLAATIEALAPAAIIIDAEHPRAGDPELLLVAQRAGAAVILSSATLSLGELRRLADVEGTGYFPLPNGTRALDAALVEARNAVRARTPETAVSSIARWARLAAHHQSRARWHEGVLARVRAEVQQAAQVREQVCAAREAGRRAIEAARAANEQLHAEVTRYVHRLREEDVPKAGVVSQVGDVVHKALDADPGGAEVSRVEAQVERWCVEAYESAA